MENHVDHCLFSGGSIDAGKMSCDYTAKYDGDCEDKHCVDHHCKPTEERIIVLVIVTLHVSINVLVWTDRKIGHVGASPPIYSHATGTYVYYIRGPWQKIL